MDVNHQLYRILDANFNRSKEGFRVCEDICRFVLENQNLSKQLKEKRHALSDVFFKLNFDECLKSRDAQNDVGRPSSKIEFSRKNLNDILIANFQRVKESLRVLEEVLKLIDSNLALEAKEIRYDIYDIEKRVFEISSDLSHSRR